MAVGSDRVGRGQDVLALMNANARKSNEHSARALRAALPRADVVMTHTLDQARRAFEREGGGQRPLLLSGGGDGTVTSLINLMDSDCVGPPVALLKLGTGNGLANGLGSDDFARTLQRLPDLPLPPPTLRYDLVEVEGRRSHFAGTGWDARIINDYRRVVNARSVLPSAFRETVVGYLFGMFRYTVPSEYRALRRNGQARVRIINTGPPAWTVDPHGELVPIPGGDTGQVIYEGTTSVASVATSEEWGFHFRAHPHARRKPRWLNIRVYAPNVLEALRNMRRLWRGHHPQPGAHDFFVKRVRFEFSRPVPFQIGGDPMGDRTELEFSVASSGVDLVDWMRTPPDHQLPRGRAA